MPIDVDDYEIIDLFNWQNSVKDMISQIEFVRMVDVQSETVDRYIKDGKIKPDLSVKIISRWLKLYTMLLSEMLQKSLLCIRIK